MYQPCFVWMLPMRHHHQLGYKNTDHPTEIDVVSSIKRIGWIGCDPLPRNVMQHNATKLPELGVGIWHWHFPSDFLRPKMIHQAVGLRPTAKTRLVFEKLKKCSMEGEICWVKPENNWDAWASTAKFNQQTPKTLRFRQPKLEIDQNFDPNLDIQSRFPYWLPNNRDFDMHRTWGFDPWGGAIHNRWFKAPIGSQFLPIRVDY